MNKMIVLKGFDAFVKELNENYTKKKSAVEDTVEKIKQRYGKTAEDFIAAVKDLGIDDVKDFIVQTVQPIARTNTKVLNADYDEILTGLVSWIMLELQIDKD